MEREVSLWVLSLENMVSIDNIISQLTPDIFSHHSSYKIGKSCQFDENENVEHLLCI